MRSSQHGSLLASIVCKGMLPGAVLLVACATRVPMPEGPRPQTPGPAPQYAPTRPAAASRTTAPPVDGSNHDAARAAEGVDARGFAAPLDSAAAPSTASATPADPPAPCGYALEDPFLPGTVFTEEQLARSPVLLSQQAELTARWNLGGSSREDHPSRSPRFHPGTRVVVDATLAGAFGASAKRATVRKQAEARVRARGYWPLRACYEASWRKGCNEPTDHTIRATLLRSGRVQATRILKTEGPADLGPCLREALAQLELGSLPARRIDADLRIRFWPGDAPLPRDAELAADACADTDAVQSLARAQQAWRSTIEAMNACVEPALARDGGLWGRLALFARFDRAGRTEEVTEFQTTFPDAALVGCVTRIIESLQIGASPCPAELVFAVRIGDPKLT